ncbi:MAG: hypothetical protein GY838_13620 [bacterium]|nr:hypothetical protein [bacterium]
MAEEHTPYKVKRPEKYTHNGVNKYLKLRDKEVRLLAKPLNMEQVGALIQNSHHRHFMARLKMAMKAWMDEAFSPGATKDFEYYRGVVTAYREVLELEGKLWDEASAEPREQAKVPEEQEQADFPGELKGA